MKIDRRLSRFLTLKSAGIFLTLPFLESLAEDKRQKINRSSPQRFFVMSNPLGMVPDAFHPQQAGKNYILPELLQSFSSLKQDISLFTNLDHGLRGGHEMTHAFLSGILQKEANSMPHGNISLDQRIAQHWAGNTRYAYLSTKAGTSRTGGFSSPALSWTREGVNIPPIDQAGTLFKKLFINDSKKHTSFKQQQFKRHQSILDAIFRQAKQLEPRLSQHDQQHLDQYFTSIRQIEKKLEQDTNWLHSSKPQTKLEQPNVSGLAHSLDHFFELIFWAFKTDQTRVATLEIPGDESGKDLGLEKSYHTYSHHGRSEENLKSIKVIESFQMQALSKFIQRLKATPDPLQPNKNMLTQSIVLFGSGLSNASAHTNTNLPILLSGGHFDHGQHHIFDQHKKTPLSNLWLSILHHFQINDLQFGRSTGTLTGFNA